MKYRTKLDTLWNDGPLQITVPAGEIIDVIDIEQVPRDRGYWDIRDGITAYAKQRRKFVPIRIRDWYGLIEACAIELVVNAQSAITPVSNRPLLVPGQAGYLASRK